MSETNVKINFVMGKATLKEENRDMHRELRQQIRQTGGIFKQQLAADLQAQKQANAMFLKESRESRRQIAAQIQADSKVERESIAETAKANRAALAEAKRGLQESSRALKQRISDENSLKVVLTQQQIQARATSELTQKLNRQRIDGAKAVLIEETRAFKGLKESSEGAASGMESLVGKYVGIGAIVGGVRAIGAAWGDVAEQQRKAAEAFQQAVKDARVAGGVSGKTPTQAAASIHRISAESGLNFNEANELKRQYEGTVPAALQKGNITQEVSDAILGETAKTGARLGGDQGTRGEMAGIVGQFGKVGSTGEGLAKLEASRKQLVDGRGDDGPLTKSLLSAAPTLIESGMVGSIEEASALIGTTSLKGGPLMADTTAKSLVKGLRGTTTEQAQKLESVFGIKRGSTEDLESRLGKVVPKLRQVKDSGTDVASFLRDEIKLPAEEVEAVSYMIDNYEMLKGRMATARQDAKSGGAGVLADNAKFLASPEGMKMRAESQGEANVFTQGERVKGASAMAALEEANLKGESPGALPAMRSFQKGIRNVASYIFPGLGNESEAYAGKDLDRQLADAGMANPYGGAGGMISGLFTPAAEQNQAKIGALQGAGQDPYAQMSAKLEKQTTVLEKIATGIESGNKEREKQAKPRPLNPGGPQQPGARAGMR